MAVVRFFISDEIMSVVTNQKSEECSHALAVSDMVGLVLQISGKGPNVLVSPQPLIDARVDSPYEFKRFCTIIGLESIRTYPFILVRRPSWDERVYSTRRYPRYKIDELSFVDDEVEIKKRILENFGVGGKKFPILGAMEMGEFKDREYARLVEESGTPYHPPSEGGHESVHALLIVGCDTTVTNSRDHYCRVKNCQGKKWGNGGFSLVGFEAFKYIMVPAYDN